jgi:nucleoside-diphosphate-sugar epimerase
VRAAVVVKAGLSDSMKMSDREPGSGDWIITPDDPILVTGASGFIGTRVVEGLLSRGMVNLRCFVRPSGDVEKLRAIARRWGDRARIEVVRGNLLSREDCNAAARGIVVIYHLAAGRGEKLVADAFMNSVVTTRNILEAGHRHGCLRRFVNISSFSVYTNRRNGDGRVLDESCDVETRPEERGDAYSFAKVKQDEIVCEYGQRLGVPYVIVRPGYVYGPGNEAITNRVGIGTFGLFLHLGGSNAIPLTYVDNCADAIVLAGLKRGVDGEVFNVVDDDLPSSRRFLRLYKRNVRHFRSIYVPHSVSYLLCVLWEKYSTWSEGQLPPVFNRKVWHAVWKKTRYSNEKIKKRLEWRPRIAAADALELYFRSCRESGNRA